MIKKEILLLVLVISGIVLAETPPICQFDGSNPGLLVSFSDILQPQDHYGILSFNLGSWQIADGQANNLTENACLRYNTTLKDQGTVTAMPDTSDWVVRVVWKQSNTNQTNLATLFELSAIGGDVLKVQHTAVNGTFNLLAGDGSGNYVTICSFSAVFNEYHTLTVYFKSSSHKLDFWVDNKKIANDFVGRNNVYGLNFIQLRGGTASNSSHDYFDLLEIGRPVVNFGLNWVRQNGVITQGLCLSSNTHDIPQYMGTNFTHMLAWEHLDGILLPARQAQLPMILRIPAASGLTDSVKGMVNYYVTRYPYLKGMIVNDEPISSKMPGTSDVLRWIRSTYPDKLLFSNAGGEENYSAHIQEFIRVIRPDVMSYDMYPFFPNNDAVPDYYWEWMWIVRTTSQAFGIPYWTFIQSFQRGPEDGQPYRHPSESDVRMQIFSSLAYGFQGLSYFTYDPFYDRGILELDYTPSVLYTPIANANAEVLKLSKCLKNLASTQIFFVPSIETTTPPEYLTKFQYGQVSNDHINSISMPLANDLKKNCLIAYFRDDNNEKYFMITNLWHDEGASSASRNLNIKIIFDSSIKKILRLSRQTGAIEHLAISDPNAGLTITLPGGTGDLFKYDTGPFVGVATGISGDANADGKVDNMDLYILADNWLSSTYGWYSGDFDNSNFVDMLDFALLSSSFGSDE